MNAEQHARILNAYLSRLSLADIEDIFRTQKEAWHASINLSLSSQIKMQETAAIAITTAMEKMIEHDKDNIQRIIKEATK